MGVVLIGFIRGDYIIIALFIVCIAQMITIVCRSIVIIWAIFYIMDKQKILTDFGLHLREIRISKSMSQEQLAEKAQVHRTYIGMLERGEKNATITTLFRLSNALCIPTYKLFPEERDNYCE